ncbi:putative methionyl-tRNA synthetase [Hordeum vulgare]|nr:putative methionyl-tRNA synthetase [Hordeum vulgare]
MAVSTPNTTFPHGAPHRSSPTGLNHDPRTPSLAFNVGLNTQYNYSPSAYSSAASPPSALPRGALSFVPGSAPQFAHIDADMDGVITSGFAAAASYPRFGVQDETMNTADGIDEELDDTEEEEREEGQVEMEPETSIEEEEGEKRPSNAKPADPRVKWTSKEDECLPEAWKTVSMDPIFSRPTSSRRRGTPT